MENKKIYFEKRMRSRCSKLRQALHNVTQSTKKEEQHEQSTDSCIKKTEEIGKGNKKIKVTETYDEVLDLRKTVIMKDKKKFQSCIKNKSNENQNNFLDKVCDLPNMHYRIMTLCSIKNSHKFSEEFNAKTNIISERIVNKQLELQGKEKLWKNKKICKISPTIGENVVVQKIIEKEKELQPNNPTKQVTVETKSKSEAKIPQNKTKNIPNSRSEDSKPSERIIKHLASRPRFVLSSRIDKKPSNPSRANVSSRIKLETPKSKSQSKDSVASSKVLMQISPITSLEKCARPRFVLSTKPTRRCAISHSSIQVTMEKSSIDMSTQTEEMKQLRNIPVQTCKKAMNVKKMQTRLLNTNSSYTDPILIQGCAKYTNTISEYPCSEQTTQMYEHLTISDVVVLDWVNKHLFGVNVNPNNIVVGDKIREASEVVSKSTFLSEMESSIL